MNKGYNLAHFDEMMPMKKTIVPGKAWFLYRRLLTDVYPFWPVLALGLLANVFYSLIDAGMTYMMKPLLDKSFIKVDLDFVKQIPLMVLLGVTFRGMTSAVGSYCMTSVARSVVNGLRQKIFKHIVHLPADYYDKATSGQLLSKILYDVEQVAQVSADALTDFVQNTCLVIGLITVMMLLCWQLSLMFLVTIPFIGIMVNYTNKRIRRISHKVQQSMGDVTEIASEVIEGYRVVRIFGGSSYEINKFNRATEISRKNDMKVALSKAINVSAVQCIIAIGIATIIFSAIKLTTLISVTAGSFLAIIAAMVQLIKPLKTLTSLSASIQRGLAGAESIFTLLDQPIESETITASNVESVEKLSREGLTFNSVSFAYRDGPTVLHDVNFHMAPGEIVALVGHSGSGKSTIASLLARFYDPTAGSITLNGQELTSISRQELRAQLALVSQQVTLFNDTIANNIAYGQFDASLSAIQKAAQLAYADEFIQALPHGYETRVGENGVLLSGGQRQRLAIARAILKNAPFLILDEATSALDNESERYIQAALEHVMQNRTTLVIAHRLSTIQKAHKIIVLVKGRVVEYGTHDALLALGGHYTHLYQGQVQSIGEMLA